MKGPDLTANVFTSMKTVEIRTLYMLHPGLGEHVTANIYFHKSSGDQDLVRAYTFHLEFGEHATANMYFHENNRDLDDD